MPRFIIREGNDSGFRPDSFMKLPKGAMSKPLRYDSKNHVLDMLIRWPEGYIEPRHTHNSSHSIVVLRGSVVVEGKELKPGSYIYAAPGAAHGPFEWHNRCTVFAHFEGDPAHHYKE